MYTVTVWHGYQKGGEMVYAQARRDQAMRNEPSFCEIFFESMEDRVSGRFDTLGATAADITSRRSERTPRGRQPDQQEVWEAHEWLAV